MIHGELIVDNFAGGGGASTGIELATGYSVDIAIKDYVYLNDYTMYVVEDISGSAVDKYHYEINFLPEFGLKATHSD